MYKGRLRNWGYSKNCTEERVKAVLHDKTMRGAVEKVFSFGRKGEDPNAQKITKYLSRKKMTLSELLETGEKGQFCPDAVSMSPNLAGTLNSSDTGSDPMRSQLAGNVYEDNCPYRPWTKLFRLIEKFPR
jgi:hypothetical protein